MSLLFSKLPGCRESHLKRLYHNALLQPKHPPTQEAVNQAHQTDLEELETFQHDFSKLMDQAISLQANTESDVILQLKEDLDKLYEQCAGLTGDTQAYKKGVARLTAVVMQAVRKGAGNDPTALSELEQEESARNMHYQLLEFPIVAHLLRPDSPIQAEDLAAVLLGENEENVSAVLSLFDQEHIMDLAKRSERLVAGYPGNIPGAPYAENIMNLIRHFPNQDTCH